MSKIEIRRKRAVAASRREKLMIWTICGLLVAISLVWLAMLTA